MVVTIIYAPGTQFHELTRPGRLMRVAQAESGRKAVYLKYENRDAMDQYLKDDLALLSLDRPERVVATS